MIFASHGDGSKAHGICWFSHQYSWDLWMFIPNPWSFRGVDTCIHSHIGFFRCNDSNMDSAEIANVYDLSYFKLQIFMDVHDPSCWAKRLLFG